VSTVSTPPPAAPFAEFLRAHRDELNQRFALARRRWPALDGDAFLGFLRDSAGPLCAATAAVLPASAERVARAAYEVGLELVGQRLMGPGARDVWIARGWRLLGAHAAALVGEEPESLLVAISNALHHLATTPGARPGDFLAELERLAPRCADPAQLLAVGKVAGWRAGLAHFRSSALAVADTLPEPLALAAVGSSGPSPWREVEARLARDPWFDPQSDDPAAVQVMARVGGFRGFGGAFPVPPTVTSEDDCFIVQSGTERWLLTADRHGATLHRAPGDGGKRTSRLPRDVAAKGKHLTVRGKALDLGAAGAVTSAAVAAETLAVTTERSHRVVLIRLAPA
jgi:hypothetical protein